MWHKILKILLALTVTLTMHLSLKPKEEANAIAPLLAGALWVAGGIAGEVAMDLGWQFIGKPAFDKIKSKVLKDVADNPDSWDFTKKKPKKNGKYLDIDVSANDRQKMATLLKKYGDDVIEMDRERESKNTRPVYDIDYPVGDPFDDTSVQVDFYPLSSQNGSAGGTGYEALEFVTRMYDITFTPQAYQKKTRIDFVSVVNSSERFSIITPGDDSSSPLQLNLYVWKSSDSWPYNMEPNQPVTYITSSGNSYSDPDYWSFGNSAGATYKAYQGYLRSLEYANRTVFLAEGVAVPEDNSKIYEIPLDTPSSYQLPWADKITKPIKIPLPDEDDSVMDIEWEDLESRGYGDEIENYEVTIVNDNDPTITNNYNQTVNNYYTYEVDSDEKTPEQIKEEITIIIDNDVIVGDGDSSGGTSGSKLDVWVVTDDEIPIHRKFFMEVQEMADQLQDMYDGTVHFMDSAVDGMQSLTTGMTGFVSFLDDFFDWLPTEYKTLLGSGFMLGVVSFFLRR